MTITDPVGDPAAPPGGRAGLVARVRGILLHPTAEWDVIDREPASVGGLFTGYACILALIPPIAMVIGGLVGGFWYAPASLVGAILRYVVSLADAFIVGLVIEALAPTFDGQKSRVQAMKLSVYGYTAAWVGAIFYIVPWIGWLGAVAMAIYGLYILYQGLPRLMHSPPEKTTGYFVLTLVVAVVVTLVLFWLVALVTASMFAATAIGGMALGHRFY